MNFDTDAAHMGVEWRLPFLDLRLVEFVLGLPTHVRFRRGVTKRLLREAMVGILPEKVRQRTGSAHFTDLIDRGLREEERGRISDLLTDPRIVRDGLVDGERLAAGWRSYWDSPGSARIPADDRCSLRGSLAVAPGAHARRGRAATGRDRGRLRVRETYTAKLGKVARNEEQSMDKQTETTRTPRRPYKPRC